MRLRVQVPDDDPVVPSLFDVHPGTEALEREVFDMFGIRFDGHPDLTRILMPEDWIGHPLRKDYAIGRIPVQFKGGRMTADASTTSVARDVEGAQELPAAQGDEGRRSSLREVGCGAAHVRGRGRGAHERRAPAKTRR